jgi:hypothetical protein
MQPFNYLHCSIVDNPERDCGNYCYYKDRYRYCYRTQCGLPSEKMFGPPGILLLLEELQDS